MKLVVAGYSAAHKHPLFSKFYSNYVYYKPEARGLQKTRSNANLQPKGLNLKTNKQTNKQTNKPNQRLDLAPATDKPQDSNHCRKLNPDQKLLYTNSSTSGGKSRGGTWT